MGGLILLHDHVGMLLSEPMYLPTVCSHGDDIMMMLTAAPEVIIIYVVVKAGLIIVFDICIMH